MIAIDKNYTKLPYDVVKAKGEIEEACIPLCDIFNELDIKTLFCCQGHGDGNHFNIIFDSCVGDDEIINLLKIINDLYPMNGYTGEFYKWYRYYNGILLINWTYLVPGDSLEELMPYIKGTTGMLRKVADYIRDVISPDKQKLILYTGGKR